MANNISNVSFGQDSSQVMEIERRKALAQALQGQATQPLETQTAGGWAIPIHPLQGVAKMAQAGAGVMQQNKALELSKALGEQQQQRRGADMSLLAQALQGRPANPGGLSEDASGNVTQMDPMAAQSPMQSIGQALPMMQDPQMQQMGMQAMMGAQQRGDQQQFQREQLQSQQAGRLQERELAIQAQNAARLQQQEFQREMVKERAAGDRPFYQFLPSSTGYMAGNARTGQVQPVQHQGQNVVPAAQDPTLQGRIAGAKASGKELGEAGATAQIDLPRVMDNAKNAIQLIDQMVGAEGPDGRGKPHPGFSSAVGMRVPGLGFVPGSDTANFNSLLDQVKGGAFLEAFNSLKGGGQITEVEGKKATDAITRMNSAQSEREFIKAAREFQGVIKAGVSRAETKAGVTQTPQRRATDSSNDPLGLRR